MKKNVKTALMIALFSGLMATASTGVENTAAGVEANPVSTPVLYKKGEKVFFNFLNTDGHKVVLLVKDSKNRVLFREVSEGELVLGKAFNFEGAEEDRYTVVVRLEDRTIIEKITIN